MSTVLEENYDLKAACRYNDIKSDDIKGIKLEILGQNDGPGWHWIVETESGFAYIEGWCDYTGWDCQSSANRYDAVSLQEALQLVAEEERRIFEDMLKNGEHVR